MRPLTIIVICGIGIAGFIGGRMTASRNDDPNTIHTDYTASSHSATQTSNARPDATSASTAPHTTTRTGTSSKLSAVKTTTELRNELRRLQDPTRGSLANTKERLRLLERLDTSNIEALVQEYAQGPVSPRDWQGMQMLFTAMAEKNPEHAWRQAQTLPPAMQRSALTETIRAMAAKTPDAALAKIDTLDNPTLRDTLRSTAILTVAKSGDPRRALDLLNPPKPQDSHLVNQVVGEMALTDMPAARTAMGKLDEPAKSSAAAAIATFLAETDPAAAWKFALENSSPASRRYGTDPRDQILSQWVQTDPKAALEAISTMQDTNRQGLLANAIRSWGAADYTAAYKHVMATTDPALLKAILDRIPSGQQYQNAVSQLMTAWAKENPAAAAAAAAAQLPLGNTYTNAVSQIATEWILQAKDKTQPIQWALTLPEAARAGALGNVFNNWTSLDPVAAGAAALKLPAAERSGVIQTIANTWAQSDPQAVIKWSTNLPAEQRQNAIQATVGTLANTDPQKAVAMLGTLGMTNDPGTVNALVNQWVNNDIAAASNWVNRLPQGDARDSSLRTVAQRLANDEPESAVAWASAIANPNQRMSTIENVVRQWKRYDPQGANEWIQSSNLPDDNKNRLLR